uniref:Uncharacterized protein n=1 Tax=Anguilla anguilla TaxID=7936 RepID=A0A0E9QFP2_ANGAN
MFLFFDPLQCVSRQLFILMDLS